MKLSEEVLTIKKSKFIGILYDIKDEKQAKEIINDLKKEHKKAKHMPYAYIVGSLAKKTDDKEPHNTAGIQIYNNLIQNDLSHHLLIVVRYFGGVKLGSSNLLHAYKDVSLNTIKKVR